MVPMALTGYTPNMLSILAHRCTESVRVMLGPSDLARKGSEPINTKAGRSQSVRSI